MKKLTLEEFLTRSRATHGSKFNYDHVILEGQNRKVKIECPEHGYFYQRPADHMARTGCPACGKIARAENRKRWTFSSFVEEAFLIHGDTYSYDSSVFSGANGPIRFRCQLHGWKDSTFSLHIYSRAGCNECSGKSRRGIAEVVDEAKRHHGDKYDYSLAEYKNGHTHIAIVCPDHGVFHQTPICHARSGQGCPRCSTQNVSRIETEWLNELGVPQRQVRLHGMVFDGYDPSTNTVYEFYGDFWHGNPRTMCGTNRVNKECFTVLYEKTKQREKRILDHGYSIVTIWESDYRKQRNHHLDVS